MTDTVPVHPSNAATYSEQRTQSVIAHRNHVRISPKYGGNFRTGSIIRLEIPSQDWLDPDLFSISYLAKIFDKNGNSIPRYGSKFGEPPTIGDESYSCRFDSPAQMVFSRVKLLQGSTVIEDIQDYGVLMKIMTLSTVNQSYLKTMGGAFEGMYDVKDYDQLKEAKQRHCWGDGIPNDPTDNEPERNKGWYYNVRPLLGLLRAGKYLPLKWMGQLTIELHCAPNQECLVSSTVGTVAATVTNTLQVVSADAPVIVPPTQAAIYDGAYYELSEVNMECHFVQPIEEYDKSAMALIEEKGLEVWFDTFATHNRQISSSGRTTLSFQERAVSLKGGYAVMQNSGDLQDYRTPLSFPDNNMREFQWKIGSHYIPAQPIRCERTSSLALAQLQTTFDAYGDLSTTGVIDSHNFTGMRTYTDAGITGDTTGGGNEGIDGLTIRSHEILNQTSLPNSFILALNLEKSPDQLSGFNSAAASVDVELNVDLFASQDSTLDIGGDRNAAVYSFGHVFQPSKFLLNLGSTGVPLNGPDSTDNWRLGGGSNGTVPENLFMVTKPIHKYSRVTFFAHLDSVLKIDRIGSVSIMR